MPRKSESLFVWGDPMLLYGMFLCVRWPCVTIWYVPVCVRWPVTIWYVPVCVRRPMLLYGMFLFVRWPMLLYGMFLFVWVDPMSLYMKSMFLFVWGDLLLYGMFLFVWGDSMLLYGMFLFVMWPVTIWYVPVCVKRLCYYMVCSCLCEVTRYYMVCSCLWGDPCYYMVCSCLCEETHVTIWYVPVCELTMLHTGIIWHTCAPSCITKRYIYLWGAPSTCCSVTITYICTATKTMIGDWCLLYLSLY